MTWCALCRSEYVTGVIECAECLVPLVDDAPLNSDAIGDAQKEQLAYELDDMAAPDRYVIDRQLQSAGIAHTWEDDGTTLLVSPDDEGEVDTLLGDGETDSAVLDDDAEQLVYDLADWDGGRRAQLAEQLHDEGIGHFFDEQGDLVVVVADEERVDALVDALEFPDQLDADGDGPGGLDAVEAVSAMFVAADRLTHDPSDSEGVVSLVDASHAAEALPLPFGYSPPVWEELLERAAELRRLLETDEAVVDDDAVVEAAIRLRSALRPYV